VLVLGVRPFIAAADGEEPSHLLGVHHFVFNLRDWERLDELCWILLELLLAMHRDTREASIDADDGDGRVGNSLVRSEVLPREPQQETTAGINDIGHRACL